VYDSSADQMAPTGRTGEHGLLVKGCRGAVIDGGVRDVDRIIEMGFLSSAAIARPADIRGRWRYVDVNVPIRLAKCWCSRATTWWATRTAWWWAKT